MNLLLWHSKCEDDCLLDVKACSLVKINKRFRSGYSIISANIALTQVVTDYIKFTFNNNLIIYYTPLEIEQASFAHLWASVALYYVHLIFIHLLEIFNKIN
jgi:hypothetical protein